MENEIWIEKYRPNAINEIVGHDKIREALQKFVDKKNILHLIFSGRAGVGKTALAIAIAKEMYGEHWKMNFTELNASDNRGIDVVRNEIKKTAERGTFGAFDFRIIFLDEADGLTSDAQAALRRTMEKYSGNCRFIISCNYRSKLIDPIQSRCFTFTFGRLSNENLSNIARNICEKEGIEIDDEAINLLIKYSKGDSRPIINAIQTLSMITDEIDIDIINDIIKIPDTEIVQDILQIAIDGEYVKAKNYFTTEFIEKGFDSYAMIECVYDSLEDLERTNIEGKKEPLDKLALQKCVMKLADFENRINSGNNPVIQFSALLAEIAFIANVPISCTALRG